MDDIREHPSLELDRTASNAFPHLSVAAFQSDNLRASASRITESTIASLWSLAAATLVNQRIDLATIAQHPRIQEWRGAYLACGVKPSSYKSSVEALVRRVLRDGRVSVANPVVAAYCAISVIHLTPLGAYDIRKLPEKRLLVRQHGGAGHFRPLGGRTDDTPLGESTIVYSSSSEIVCACFNYRDSAATCLDETTDRAVFCGESLSPAGHVSLRAALLHLRSILATNGSVCGQPIEVSTARPRAEIQP